AFTATGANLREMLPPAENSAMSTPSNERSVSSSITICLPRKATLLPAERALASAFSRPTGKARRSMVAMNSAPTAPVTPTIATTGSLLTLALHFWDHAGNKKAPDLCRRGFGGRYASSRLRAHASRTPKGLGGFGRGFRSQRHGADLCGTDLLPSTGADAKKRLKPVESGLAVTQ